jgi:hypothetical protein
LAIKFLKAKITCHRPMIDAESFKVLDEHRFEGKPFDSQLDDRSVGKLGMSSPSTFRREASRSDKRVPCISPLADVPPESPAIEVFSPSFDYQTANGAVSAR